MNENNVVPIRPVPDDGEVSEYLGHMFRIDGEQLDTMMEELKQARQNCEAGGWPSNFAYGQMINKLKETLKEDLVHMLAAAMWGQLTDE